MVFIGAILSAVERAKTEGIRLGIEGTPTLFFNGRRYKLRETPRGTHRGGAATPAVVAWRVALTDC
ncbi:MAG: hypothetical protein JRH20_08250 [Deltaproteobacteria bacterium]|nr:hypothetical protein [Deltaproteobacteria bacterium]